MVIMLGLLGVVVLLFGCGVLMSDNYVVLRYYMGDDFNVYYIQVNHRDYYALWGWLPCE